MHRKVFKIQNSLYKILSYKIKHSYDIDEFLSSYKYLLQSTVDIIWSNINWVERKQRKYYFINKMKRHYYTKRLIPIIPSTRVFKRKLRNVQ